MIVLTGAGGFIGSYVLGYLNRQGRDDIIIYDDLRSEAQQRNVQGKRFFELRGSKDSLPDSAEAVIHLGANSNTLATDWASITNTNVDSTRRWYHWSQQQDIPMIYASSAAILGNGEGPLNQYAFSKQINEQECRFAAGLRLYNVYGPNEYHKGRMASVVFHAFNQITATGGMKLFRSHRPDYKDGEQLRDFVYVKDVCNVCLFLMEHRTHSGLYNLGSGKARTFLDLVRATFSAMGKEEHVSFVDTPADIRDKYQYFTEADMRKLQGIGYTTPFTTLEDGVRDYVGNYLSGKRYT